MLAKKGSSMNGDFVSANMASTPLGLLQLIIYFIYRKKGIMEEPNKWDIEQNEEKSKQLQLVTGNNILMTRVD
ncbi:hypothetical protein QYF36_012283 [Acer negundo]|nr:hypothetical protein QYF36_012283 [Acer negundo]